MSQIRQHPQILYNEQSCFILYEIRTSNFISRLQAYLKLLGRSPLPYVIFASTSCPPDITHVMNETRPSPFFCALPLLCIILNANRRTQNGNEATYMHCTLGSMYTNRACLFHVNDKSWLAKLVPDRAATSCIQRREVSVSVITNRP